MIPCYNDIQVLPLLEERLGAALASVGMPWEVVFVDDGSKDGSYRRLAALRAADSRFKVVRFSRTSATKRRSRPGSRGYGARWCNPRRRPAGPA